MPALFTNGSVVSPQLAARSFAAKLADAVRLVEEVVAVAQRFLRVLVDRNGDRLDVLITSIVAQLHLTKPVLRTLPFVGGHHGAISS